MSTCCNEIAAERDRLDGIVRRVETLLRGPFGNGPCICIKESELREALGAPATDTVHQCPPGGEYITPCCGRPIAEVPRTDRVTLDAYSVTCTGRTIP